MGFPTSNIKEDYITFTFTDSGGVQQGQIAFTNFEIPAAVTELGPRNLTILESRAGIAYQQRETSSRGFSFSVLTAQGITFNKLITFFQLMDLDLIVRFDFPYYQIYQPITRSMQILPQSLAECAIEVSESYRQMFAAVGNAVDVPIPFIVKNSFNLVAPPIGTAGTDDGPIILIPGPN